MKKKQYKIKPPGFGRGWIKDGKFWINPKNGDKWRFHPEDEFHYAHWDRHIPGKGKERIPIYPNKGVLK